MNLFDKTTRRDFLQTSGKTALGVGLAGTGAAAAVAAGKSDADKTAKDEKKKPSPESLVKTLYESMTPGQREAVCFDWDHKTKLNGVLRTHVAANWDITDKMVQSSFYTSDQQEMVRQIFEGIIDPSWHERMDKQLKDDSGGFGKNNSIAIFGTPGTKQFEFVLTGRHMTLRADGNSTEHMAFGGPIFYGHAAETFNESPKHRGNVFWPQAQAANKLYQMLDGEQQEAALVRKGMPDEYEVEFEGKKGKFQGIPVAQLADDQQKHMQLVLKKLIEPYRKSDREEAMQCLNKQGGLKACHLAYYAEDDIGNDGVWDNWRLEGPSFVWHFRGAPHVHVWVNVGDDPKVKLNAG